ncbi:MAG: alpha/beta fold hydrolase [Ilumatobacteraceae bacterium]|nr:alpha/beta fold hydrolase [Ilumatobacteraceae bacterium]
MTIFASSFIEGLATLMRALPACHTAGVTMTSSQGATTHKNPSPLAFAMEPAMAAAQFAGFTLLTPLLTRLPVGDGRPVLVLPGFTASDQSTAALRYVLARLDYSVHGWHLGQNLGPTQRIVDGLFGRFDDLYQRHGNQPITLVGWSLGGLYARALAARKPEAVRHVISLGSPFRLDRAEETNAGRVFDLLAPVHGLRRPHSVEFRREPYLGPPAVPSTAIFTRGDGVVPWNSCIDDAGPRAENIQVYGSHCGLGYNPAALNIIADRLRLGRDEWRPFQPRGLPLGPYRAKVHHPA